jgi:hypothetical protein
MWSADDCEALAAGLDNPTGQPIGACRYGEETARGGCACGFFEVCMCEGVGPARREDMEVLNAAQS